LSAWLLLALAIGSELVGTTALKASAGFKRPLPSLAVVACYGISFFCLSQSLTVIPLGVAYAIWSGVGIAATALIGAVVFREALTRPRSLGVLLVIAGVVALNLAAGAGGGK
jgi:small multidrug resistance pump